jgi:hypothetical protein
MLLELYKASLKTEGMAGGPSNLGAEVVFRVLFRMAICKMVIDSVPKILGAIYDTATKLTLSISNIINETGSGGIDIAAMEASINLLEFWEGLVFLILCFLVYLIIGVSVIFANIIITARFIELYVYFVIAPIPLATFPSEDMSQIGKNFLKSFAAVSIQGTLIFIVLSFFPLLFTVDLFAHSTDGDLFAALFGVLSYAIVLLMAIFATGKWAKSICNAM